VRRRLAIALSLAIITIIVISTFAAIEVYRAYSASDKKPFYLGVTYCGDSVTGAEQLINEVKNYTNLFVLDSGTMMNDGTALNETCSYAVDSGLNVIVFFANNVPTVNLPAFVQEAQAQWGSHFLGIYYDDEPGGKMLDWTINLYVGDERITKQFVDGPITVNYVNSSDSGLRTFYNSGEVTTSIDSSINETIGGIANVQVEVDLNLDYLPNGTISCTNSTFVTYPDKTCTTIVRGLIYEPNGLVLTDKSQQCMMTTFPNGSYTFTQNVPPCAEGNISQFEPYQQVWASNPIQTYAEAAEDFETNWQQTLDIARNDTNVKFFTADYGLDWFDYKGGYDVVLAELGWNQSTTQNIAEIHGAADLQGKSWGTMIDWQSLSPITLQSGSQMYSEMKQSYESGAEYVVVFNYSPNNNGTGLLQDEQFSAIQSFWTNVIKNPSETNNVKGQDALVLPNDYGWGMRSPTDNIWGVWPADNQSQQVWNAVQSSLAKYGSKLDIVYDDPAYPTDGHYQHVVYWNQTT
jgi:hypothetical protein